MTIIEAANAKINLGLKVTGRRPDGYHSILSLFQTVDLADTIELSGSAEPGLRCSDPAIPSGPDNLVLAAEAALLASRPDLPRLAFNLTKHIPVGAGLGGGSADAAAALRGLDAFHRLDLAGEELVKLAAAIGSDVPFLIEGGSAIVSGRGEVVERIDWPFHFTYVLVYPGFAVSTAWAYGQLGTLDQEPGPYREMLDALRGGSLHREDLASVLVNDFEKPVFGTYPILAGIKQRLIDGGAVAAVMSGSGSTMIGLFESEPDAFHCANTLHITYRNQFSICTVPAAGNVSVTG